MRWVLPPKGFFVDLDVPKLQYIPILIGEAGSYPVEANRYLIERSCGEWAPGLDESVDPPIPTLKSRKNIASRVCAFFYWCDQVACLNWRTMTYAEDLLQNFQAGLISGTASLTSKPLSPSTINLYVDEACAFLTWAGDRGYREAFKVPQRRVRLSASSGAHSHSYQGKGVVLRLGKLSQPVGRHRPMNWTPSPAS